MTISQVKRTNIKYESKKDRKIDFLFFFLLVAMVSAVTLYLFYRQTTGNEASFHSDMKAYILEMQGLDSGYSFPYPVFFKLGALIHLFLPAELSVAVATMLLNSLAIVTMKYYMNRLLLPSVTEGLKAWKPTEHKTFLSGVLVSILAVSLFFISMIYLPGGYLIPGLRFKYLGVFTANPFHNATYMAARPFAIMAFFSYAGLLDTYEEGADIKDYVFFSVSLLLSTMTKPSFTIVLVGAAGLIMLYRMFRSKFANFKNTIILGLCFIPTFADLLYQYKGVFVPEEGAEGGIGFCFGEVWMLYCKNFPAALLLGVGFPIVILLFHHKEMVKNTLYRFSWQVYAMSFGMAFLIYEKGFRKPDFNFSWGYMYGIFFAFVGGLILMVQTQGAYLSGKEEHRNWKRLAVMAIEWCMYLAHLVCGLYYFYGFLRGNMYY